MGAGIRILAALLALLALAATRCAAQQLSTNYYATICPNVETLVRDAVTLKVQQNPVAVGATVRLFFHDCFVQVPFPFPLHLHSTQSPRSMCGA
jgi:peroxidase